MAGTRIEDIIESCEEPKRILSPYAWVEHIPFAFFLTRLLRPTVLVELGVHQGNSFNAFCQSVATHGIDCACYGVDTWRGDEHAGFYDDRVFEDLRDYTSLEYGRFAHLLRMTFDEALPYFSDASIDLLHIDGLHTREAVTHDFQSWRPKISDRGVVLLHDTQVREHNFGVWKLWEELSPHYPSYNFTYGHGLGVLAVGKNIDSGLIDFLSGLHKEPVYQKLFYTLGSRVSFKALQAETLDELCRLKGQMASLSEANEHVKLYIDTGSGFSEKQCITRRHDDAAAALAFDVTAYPGIHRLRFDPLNTAAVVHLGETILTGPGGEKYSIVPSGSNAVETEGSIYFFNAEDPQIYFDVSSFGAVSDISINITYYKKGNAALSDILLRIREAFRNSLNYLAAQKDKLAEEKNSLIAEKDSLIGQKDSAAAALRAEIDAIHRSRLWKASRKAYVWYSALFPKNTLRRAAMSLFIAVAARLFKALKKNKHRAKRPGVRFVHELIERDIIRYNIDSLNIQDNAASITGWIFSHNRQIRSLKLVFKNRLRTKSYSLSHGLMRQDVFKRYAIYNARLSGFSRNLLVPYWAARRGAMHLRAEFDDKTSHSIALKHPRELVPQPDSGTSLRDAADHFYTSPHCDELPMQAPVDIIVPVYNGFEYLDAFFSSIVRSTSVPFRLIVIDDCSPDPRVKALLRDMREKHAQVILIENQTNLGFVKSVNKGLRIAQSHCVVMNTDVEVPPRWLERLMAPIISLKGIASATPFTNAGTLCSFPNFLVDNRLFKNLAVDELDAYFRFVIPHDNYHELPTGIGFCMAMSRKAVRAVGLFDEETFGKGYGEENDWCIRAQQKGFKNVIVPNLFVYHKHGGSFVTEEARKQKEDNLGLVEKKHPGYLARVAAFVEADPYRHIRDFLTVLVACGAGSRPVLIIDHELGGGANIYAKKMIRERLAQGGSIFRLTYSLMQRRFTLAFYHGEYEIRYTLDSFSDVHRLLDFVNLDEIIINELVTFPSVTDIVTQIRQIKEKHPCRITIPLHDYFCICPCHVLLNERAEFCGIPNAAECRRCLKRNALEVFITRNEDIDRWRQSWASLLKNTDRIICFSEASKNILLQAYPWLDESSLSVVPHTVDDIAPVHVDKKDASTLHVGILGTIGLHKGSTIIKRMDAIIRSKRLNAKLIVIGDITVDGISRPDLSTDTLTITGAYDRKQLPGLIAQHGIDLFFIPSIWPETFSFTAEEVMKMEMPLAVFNLGAHADRVRQYNKGLVIDKVDAAYALENIIGWRDKKNCLYLKRGDFNGRESIAGTYIRGEGIEIGALHNPLKLPAAASVKYVDKRPVDELQKHYPELSACTLVPVSILDDGQLLVNVGSNTQDFVIANHVIEHFDNPILGMKNMLRVLKAGGILYLAVPDKRYTPDRPRQATSFDHLVRDFIEGPSWSRDIHFEEWAQSWCRLSAANEISSKKDELMRSDYSIHYHVWELDGMLDMLHNLKVFCTFEIVAFFENNEEIIFILQKDGVSENHCTALQEACALPV